MNRITTFLLVSSLLGVLSAGCSSAGSRGTVDPAPSAAQGSSSQSIRRWVVCDGRSDDAQGVARAFAAARDGAFTLLVDCPVRVHVGSDIGRTIFIDNGTHVRFTAGGRLIVDNVLIPAFVIANSSHIELSGWQVEYDASLPVEQKVGGYTMRGHLVPGTQPPNAFNDLALTPWLAANRGIHFDRNVHSRWSGATNLCAIFFIIGDVADLRVTDMSVSVPAQAGAERFAPVVFAFDPGYRSNQSVTAALPFSSQYLAVPHDLTFSNITFDGTYMGWVGGVRDALFEHIVSHRYADLQDATGGHAGGVGKWFAPPHLFYLSYPANADEPLVNSHIQIRDVVDDGPRVGTARDKGGADSLSGYALSLKIGCKNCSVERYRTNRPDGFLDVLASDGLTISDVEASYDSSFINNLFPGWRFPSSPYRNVQFHHIAFADVAPVTTKAPIGDATQSSNQGIVFDHVTVTLNRWGGSAPPLPAIGGADSSVDLEVRVRADSTQIVHAQRGALQVVTTLKPATVRAGGTTQLSWSSRQASSCEANGLVAGALPPAGSRQVSAGSAGDRPLTISCRDRSSSATAHAELRVTP